MWERQRKAGRLTVHAEFSGVGGSQGPLLLHTLIHLPKTMCYKIAWFMGVVRAQNMGTHQLPLMKQTQERWDLWRLMREERDPMCLTHHLFAVISRLCWESTFRLLMKTRRGEFLESRRFTLLAIKAMVFQSPCTWRFTGTQ